MEEEGNLTHSNCSIGDDGDEEFLKVFEFWLSGVAQVVVSAIGILGNCLSIPVLCSKQMNSVFNRLLVFLAVFDNIHLILTIFDSFR